MGYKEAKEIPGLSPSLVHKNVLLIILLVLEIE
jgi:hypothetical protein